MPACQVPVLPAASQPLDSLAASTLPRVQFSSSICSVSRPTLVWVSFSVYTGSPRRVTSRTKCASARLPPAAKVAMPLAWSVTVMPYCPMPSSVENCPTSSVAGRPRRSTRTGSVRPGCAVHIASTPDFIAMSSTFAAPRCSVRSKNVTFSEATVASHRVQSGWQRAVLALRTGPAGEPFVRPDSGNSFTAGESQCDFTDTFWRSASARSYTLNDEPGGCCPKPRATPASS